MGRTRPLVPVDEVPVDRAVLARILKHAPPGMILVGGQALAFWMRRFGIGARRGSAEQALSGVTTDVDFLGSIEDGRHLSQILGARFVPSDKRTMSALVGQVRIGASGSLDYNIDILHQLYDAGGLRRSIAFTRRVRARASDVEIEGLGGMRVLHPLDVLASRIHNVAGFTASKGPHVVTQARWAVKVARRALERLVRDGEVYSDRPGALAAEVFRLALSRVGRIAWQEHAIEVAGAIPFALMSRKVRGFHVQSREMLNALQEQGRLADSRKAG